MQDTPDLSQPWCRGCEPLRDPLTEILRTYWCDAHTPQDHGVDDVAVPQTYLLSSGESDGETCRRFAALLRGEGPDVL